MERNFQVVDLIDSKNGRYLGQALYCCERKECPLFTINDRVSAGEMFEAFGTGAREVGGTVNFYHINMPIEINSNNTPYNEIRNTIVKEMQIRTIRSEKGDSFERTELPEQNSYN